MRESTEGMSVEFPGLLSDAKIQKRCSVFFFSVLKVLYNRVYNIDIAASKRSCKSSRDPV